MPNLKSLTLIALIALAAGPGFAQEAATTVEPVATTPDPVVTDPTAPAALPEVDMGVPVTENAEPQIGQTYDKEVFGDWSLRCLKTEDGNDPCQLYQLLMDGDGNAVAEISLRTLPEGSEAVAGATIVAPLETLLTQPLMLTIDSGEARRYPFRFCNRAGCVAQVGFTAAEIAQFKRGAAGKLTLVPAGDPEAKVELVISLSGFTAGYDAVAAQ